MTLLDDAGEPYSFAGATATLFPLNAAFVTPGQSRTGIGSGTVAADGSTVTLSARNMAIRDTRLYVVQFSCPANMPDDDCAVNAPLHVVLNGTQLKAGGWQATALTEAAFHEVAYAVAVGYAVADVQTVLDNTAAALLVPSASDSPRVYADLLAWNPADTSAVLRANQLIQFGEALAAGADSNTIKRLTQQWITPLVGSLALNYFATDVVLAGQYAYVLDSAADADGALRIVDVSDPAQPVLVGSLGDMGTIVALQVVGDRAYVAEWQGIPPATQGALHIVDLSDPQQPTRLGRIETLGRANDVVMAGDYAVVMQGSGPTFAGLEIIDVSNPQAPVAVGSLPVTGLEDLAVVDNLVYAVGAFGLFQIDISNPAQPILMRGQQFNGARAITFVDNYVYTTGYTWGEDIEYAYDDANVIRVIDISNPAWPVVGSVQTSGGSSTLTLVGDRLYASGSAFLEVIDVSNPVQLRRLGQLSVRARGHWVQPDGLAYVAAGFTGLEVHDTRIVDRPPLLAAQLAVQGGVSDNAAVADGFAYSLNQQRGLYIFGLSNPLAPQMLRQADGSWQEVESFVPFGQYAFVTSDEDNDMVVYDISNPLAMQYLAGINFYDYFNYDVHTVVADGNRAYASYSYINDEDGNAEYGGLFVIDFQYPSSLQILSRYQTAPKADALAVSGDYVYLALASGVVEVIDVSDPLAPVAVATLALPGPVESLTASGDTLYMGAGAAGLHLVDISEPESPALLATLDTPGFATVITLIDGYAYVADGTSGVQVVAVGNRAAPMLVGAADTLGVARGLFQVDDWLYVGTGYGFEVLKTLPAPAPVSAPALAP